MSKAIKYAKNAAIFLGIANAILNAIKQLNEIEKKPTLKFNWQKLLFAAGKGALVGGAVGYGVGLVTDIENENEKPINTDGFLYNIINSVKLNKTDREYLQLNQIAEILVRYLENKFQGKLKNVPIYSGSTNSGTALRDNFDIDVYLLFKPNSFYSTKEMYYQVADSLERLVGTHSIIQIREQPKSIGVIVNIEGVERKIDIVPYKLIKGKERQKSGYLHLRSNAIIGDNSTYTKTNIEALHSIKLSKTQENILIILKNWKLKNELPLSSHLLKNLILDAYTYNRYRIPQTLTKKVIMVLRHIADKLDIAVIRSIENTNNILTNISEDKKSLIINACIDAIEDYEYQPNSIIQTLQ